MSLLKSTNLRRSLNPLPSVLSKRSKADKKAVAKTVSKKGGPPPDMPGDSKTDTLKKVRSQVVSPVFLPFFFLYINPPNLFLSFFSFASSCSILLFLSLERLLSPHRISTLQARRPKPLDPSPAQTDWKTCCT